MIKHDKTEQNIFKHNKCQPNAMNNKKITHMIVKNVMLWKCTPKDKRP